MQMSQAKRTVETIFSRIHRARFGFTATTHPSQSRRADEIS
jgi:hypothetical protein